VVLGPLLVSVCMVLYNAFRDWKKEQTFQTAQSFLHLFFTPPGTTSKARSRTTLNRGTSVPASAIKASGSKSKLAALQQRGQLSDSELMPPPSSMRGGPRSPGRTARAVRFPVRSASEDTPSAGYVDGGYQQDEAGGSGMDYGVLKPQMTVTEVKQHRRGSSSPQAALTPNTKKSKGSSRKAASMRSHSMYQMEEISKLELMQAQQAIEKDEEGEEE
jgi:hypothetical protein